MEKMFFDRPVPRRKNEVLLRMPAQIRYSASPRDWRITRTGKGEGAVFQWWEEGNSVMLSASDPKAIYRNFFSVRNADSLEEFLQSSGPFRIGGIQIDLPTFAKWQAYFRLQGDKSTGWGPPPESGPSEASDRVVGEPHLRIRPIPGKSGKLQNTLVIECRSVVETVAAVIYLQKKTGEKAAFCLSCGKSITPKRSTKRYCDRKCMHREWREKKQSNAEVANGNG